MKRTPVLTEMGEPKRRREKGGENAARKRRTQKYGKERGKEAVSVK